MPEKFRGIKRLRAVGGWMDDDNTEAETFNVTQVKTGDYRARDLAGNEPAYYTERLIEYSENEWFAFLYDFLVASLFSDVDFSGPGAEEVREFFNVTCPDANEEIFLSGLEACRDGTGFLLKIRSGGEESGKLIQVKSYPTRNIALTWENIREEDEFTVKDELEDYDDSKSVEGERRWTKIQDTVTKRNWWFREYPRETKEDYKNPSMAILRIRKGHASPYGIPVGKSCFHVLKALKMTDRDVLAALKKVAANLLVVKFDTTAFNDEEKDTEMEAMGEDLKGLSSATADVVIMDKAHDVGYMSNLEGHSGGYDGRLIAVMQHLEPVLTAILLNFMVALGIVEQTGANKSIIARQLSEARKQTRRLQDSIATFYTTQIIPEITQEEVQVHFKPAIDIDNLILMYTNGSISREWLQEYLGIRDDGTTFSTPDPMLGGVTPKSDTNNDDTGTKKTREEPKGETLRG